tara:strand:+ start:5471 stop:6193 length:723 start_codon:yes stop_codon:yes gene_type:complete
MAERVLDDCKFWYGGFDLSGDMNAMTLRIASELQETTRFGNSTRTRIGGLKAILANAEGLWNGGDGAVDDVLFDNLAAKQPVTICATDGADGEPAFAFQAITGNYETGGAVGEVLPFSVEAESDDSDLVRGTIMHNATRSATGNGTARQLGAVSASQRLFAALHVIATTGSPTLDVIVESDAADDFSGSETTRITFAQATAAGAEWATPVAGAITDDWFRSGYTIGGTGTITFVVFIGIL